MSFSKYRFYEIMSHTYINLTFINLICMLITTSMVDLIVFAAVTPLNPKKPIKQRISYFLKVFYFLKSQTLIPDLNFRIDKIWKLQCRSLTRLIEWLIKPAQFSIFHQRNETCSIFTIINSFQYLWSGFFISN